MYSEYEIRTMPLSLKSTCKKVEEFLNSNDLRLDDVDYYACVFRLDDDRILAGGGLKGNIIKCLAVSDEEKGNGLSNRLISHLISIATQNNNSVKVFTKPTNKEIFSSLGFEILAQSDKAILLENNLKNINDYCDYLKSNSKQGVNGCIVMNCNPFTKGHRFLIEQSAKEVDNLFIIAVKEDVSMFSYSERKAMIESGTKDLENVTVLQGSDYAVSKLTFPTYFIKDLNDTTDTHINLDLDLFVKFIAPSLNIKIRFVGSEPTDALTKRYNEIMHETLPKKGIDVVEIKRLEAEQEVISASALRNYIKTKSLSHTIKFAYTTTLPYIVSMLAKQSLQEELDTTPKPGLVDKSDSGAHQDMDYALMNKSINALHPYFTKLALLGFNEKLADINSIRSIGIEAEKAMFDATNGINTHKGALFSMGIVVFCAAHILYKVINGSNNNGNDFEISKQSLQDLIKKIADQFSQPQETHGNDVLKTNNIKGALAMAREGYEELFSSWLGFYQTNKDNEFCLHRLLFLIMSTLDDTNIYYRKGKQTAQNVKNEAKQMFSSNDFSIYELQKLNNKYIRENISPGGAADMLSLTIFISSVIN